jgi:hypothetical protein
MKSLVRTIFLVIYLLNGPCYTTHGCAGEEYCLRKAANSNQNDNKKLSMSLIIIGWTGIVLTHIM